MVGNWSAVIINYNGAVFLELCLSALRKVMLQPHQIIVVDNASTDDSLLTLNAFPEANVLPQVRNRGFAGGANVGLAEVETDYAVVMNTDVELEPDFGHELVRVFDGTPELGAAGSLLLYPGGETIQHAGGVIEHPLLTTRHRGYGAARAPEFDEETDIDFATGAALGLRMKAFGQVGGFDEALSPAYYEDVDLCTRLRATGWQVKYIPTLLAIHYEGVTLQHSPDYYAYLHRNRLRYALKHLSSTAWYREFLPAEIERLRGEFQVHFSDDWPQITGAGAIDSLLRTQPGNQTPESLLQTEPLSRLAEPMENARNTWNVQGQPLRSRVPLVGWFRNLVNNLGPRWYVDDALARQRDFNEAVVQSLEVQDRINREQTATTLLYALILLERSRVSSSRPDGREPGS